MIKVSLEIPESNDALVLRVKGHAGADDPGKDVVCSAVSTLVYLLAQRVKDMMDCGILHDDSEIVLEDGNSWIICKPLPEHRDLAAHDYLMIQRGFELIETNYPDYVRFRKKLVTGIMPDQIKESST